MKLINTTNSHAAWLKVNLPALTPCLSRFIPRAILMLFLHKPQPTTNC